MTLEDLVNALINLRRDGKGEIIKQDTEVRIKFDYAYEPFNLPIKSVTVERDSPNTAPKVVLSSG